jgi:enoyl-CoA hydratase/carnithine racemase
MIETVWLNNPPVNAVNRDIIDTLWTAFEILGDDVRAVVLRGRGDRAFSAGADITGFVGGAAHGERPAGIQPVADLIENAPVPVIAAIHGYCLGGGLQIALGADIRFATPDARLSVLEVKWGLIPDMAITRTLPRLVGIDVAKELAFTGRVLGGTEAGKLGLVTHVVDDPLAAAQSLAAEIAARSPDAVRGMKRLFNESWTGSPQDTLRLEADIQLGLLGTANQLEAVRAGMLKEPAQFTDPS